MAERAHADAPHHAETSYVAIWGVLCALLGTSVLGPMVGVRFLTLIAAFGIAIVKAYLVFFGGVAPDVLEHEGLRWQKTYVEPATSGGER
ncbi:MAG: hypothetical protein HY655_02180 [Acidobacteria bacterium]|nr:hypothetical protein [Acidobacteriota bacterium]